MPSAGGVFVIGLDVWVLQDGNYPDFVTGQQTRFALEFWSPGELRRIPSEVSQFRYTGEGNLYEVSAQVVHAEHAVVLDFGLRAYDEHVVLGDGVDVEAGDQVAGMIGLSVDHFAYFEDLARQPRMPALIYSWVIDKIELDTTPLITVVPGDDAYPADLPPEGPVRVRDPTRRSWRIIDETRMWEDDEPERMASYLLTCTLLDAEPSHTLVRSN